ncbi:hypothetical protein POJ06DRAFT_235527 [Lipomyces tetrasporus]|uniref:Nucleosome assembly protein n=1 Tax=Lipomyces tetrasporus TaxID=54092 RepID=A0AAD7QX77_9ASCO|nr:uncharacterized protein POJ06DRAFT_235527 [Lipomyces tetrasporus]KAJ8102561.1 hypothetical protein POJ06DRAFT_235527 [Lipomyces tetrasporus]
MLLPDKAAVAGLVNNPTLISMIEGRLGTLVGRSSGYIESLPGPVKDRISGLKGLQKDHAALESEFRKEILELEKKYAEKYKPLYERRAKIVTGEVEPSEEEIAAGKEEDADEEDVKEEEAPDAEEEEEEEEEVESPIPKDAKGIPEFWLTAMKNVPALAETITDKDEEALKYLSDIQVEFIEQPGFKLVFEFAENEFFSNSLITKTYFYQDETTFDGDYIYDHAVGDKIEWKDGKNLTVRVEKKKQRNKHTKATRTVEKLIPIESFFNFFSPPIAPEDDEDEAEIPEDLEERLQLDYQLGEEVKEKLIPRAIDWYTGEALDYDELDQLDPDDLEEYEDEEDDDEEDDDEDEEDDDGDAKPKQEAAECKQS